MAQSLQRHGQKNDRSRARDEKNMTVRILWLTLLILALSACSLNAAETGVGRSENHSTEYGDLYDVLDRYGMRCEGQEGTVIDVAALDGRYSTEATGGTAASSGSCRMKVRCDIDSYSYWPGGGVLRAALDEFSLVGSAYRPGLVHANGHALLAKHNGGVLALECTTPQRGDDGLLDSVERAGLTCMTPSGNSMFYAYEFAPDEDATLMWPENGGRCAYALACRTSLGDFDVRLPDLEPEENAGPASFAAEQILLRRAGAAAEALRCRSSRR